MTLAASLSDVHVRDIGGNISYKSLQSCVQVGSYGQGVSKSLDDLAVRLNQKKSLFSLAIIIISRVNNSSK